MKRLNSLIKYLRSYSKKNWDFDDYPIHTWKNPNAQQKKIQYGAGINNWPVMVGHGETKEEALESLKESYKLYKDNNSKLPRPGTKVPIQFETTEQIDKYENIAVDFFKRVLNMDYYGGFYSDGSGLGDFELYNELSNGEEEAKNMREDIIRRTILLYNLDITDIYDEPLWKIFQAIKSKNILPK